MDFILRAYAPDPQSVAARRRRLFITIGLAAFCLVYGLAYAFFAPLLMWMFAVPPVFVGFFVIWALPEMHNPPTRTLEFLFFAFIISLAVWPNDLAVALPGLPWITVIRLSLYPMTLVMLICLSASARFRSDLATILSSSKAILTLLLAFVVMQFLSIVFSVNRVVSIDFFIVTQIAWTTPFLVAAYIYAKPGRALMYTRIAWAVTVFICLIGLLEWKMGKVPWNGHIPSFLKIDDPLVTLSLNGITRAGVGVHRVQSIFTHPTTLSEYLALVAPFVFDFAVQKNKFLIRVAAIATVCLMAFVVYLTNSRTGSIGFFVAFLVYAFFWSVEQRRSGERGLFGSAVFYGYPVAAFVLTIASVFVGRIRNKVWGGSETRTSTNGREMQWEKGIPIIKHNPIGHGIDTSGLVLQFREPNGQLTVDSYYLTMLLDVGVVGFLIYYAIWIVSIAQTGRTSMLVGQEDRELSLLIPITCTLINYLIIKSVMSQIDNHPLVYTILGMGVALTYRAKVVLAARASRSLVGGRIYDEALALA